MKRKIHVALLLAFAATAPAQDSEWNRAYLSNGALNGRFWVDAASGLQGMKLGLVMGLANGSMLAVDCGKKDGSDLDNYQLVTPDGMTFGERVTALDNFFADPLNRSIPILSGLGVVKAQKQGADVSHLILQLRKNAIAPAGKSQRKKHTYISPNPTQDHY